MRIHGDKVIKRRLGLEERSDYHEYCQNCEKIFNISAVIVVRPKG